MIIVYIIFVIAYAIFEAKSDAKQIFRGENIDHVDGMVRRAIALFFATLVSQELGGWDAIGFVLQVVIASGIWNPVFRLVLNTERDRDEFYMAPWSNKYDLFMLKILLLRFGQKPKPDFVPTVKRDYFDGVKHATSVIHSSGKLAYLFELIVFLIGLAAFGKIVLHLY